MRSKTSKNGHSNQCVYDRTGRLVTKPPGVGTVDYKSPPGFSHYHHDVEPVFLANHLDGGKHHSFADVIRGAIAMVTPAGRNVLEYYKVRPAWTEDCP